MKLKFTTPFFAIFILTSLVFAQNNLNDFVEQVTEESIRDWFYRSSDPSWDPLKFHQGKIREEGSSGHDSAMAFIETSLKNYLGEDNVYIDEFPWSDGTNGKGYNIIGVKSGLDTSNAVIWVVGAHYDSYDKDRTGDAPGANDNGSGIVAVLEMARVINTRESDATILFCLWDAEEPRYTNQSWASDACFGSASYSGPSGSRAWINDHFTSDQALATGDTLLWDRFKGNINLDMFGFPATDNTVWLYHGGSGWNDVKDDGIYCPISDSTNTLYSRAKDYLETYGYDDETPPTYLQVIGKGTIEYSDNISFSRAGVPSLEYAESSWSTDDHYHKWSDYYRPASGDGNFDDENPQIAMMIKVIRGSLALLADTAGVNIASEVPLPVELMEFKARSEREHILLSWKTASEQQNLGFIIEKRQGLDKEWNVIISYLKDSQLIGQGNTSVISEYSYCDNLVEFGESYEYRLSEVDFDGNITPLKNTSAMYRRDMYDFILNASAYPNPFNPSVSIDYTIERDADVSVKIYDMNGRPVETLMNNKHQSIGEHHFSWNAGKFSSGLYLVCMNVVYDDHIANSQVFKLVLNK